MRSAAAVVSLYPAARSYLIERYRLDPDHVVVIPNGVPSRSLPTAAERASARNLLGVDPRFRWVTFLGSLSEEKRPDAAIRAVARIPNVGLIVAGGGPEEERCRQLAAQLARDRVMFLGVTSQPEIALAASDALVLPSRTEGVPAVAIEAGLAGLPVIGTNVGGIPTVVVDGETGILVESTSEGILAEAISTALDRPQLGSAAAERCAGMFTLEAVVPRWADLLVDVAAAGSRPTQRS